MDTLFKPVAIDYNLGSVNGFDRVNITMKNDKYLISFYMSGKYGGETFFEIKDAIIGGMGFLANEQDINNHFKFYENYDECIEVLKSRNLKNLIYDFDKFKVNSSRFLLAIKLVENTTKKFTSYFDDNGEPIFVGDGLKKTDFPINN